MVFVFAGVLGYYHAQLTDMIQYPDLRITVFHAFKEIGNAILFCLLVEQALVQLCCITASIRDYLSAPRSSFVSVPGRSL